MTAVAGTAAAKSDLRGVERRVRTISLRYPERRTGFDRRVTSRYQTVLGEFRSNPRTIAGVLSLILILNALDLALTVRALGRGATEANPIMAWLFDQDLVAAAMFKLGLSLAVVLVIWHLRNYRRVLELSLVIAGVFVLVIGYHLVGVVVLP